MKSESLKVKKQSLSSRFSPHQAVRGFSRTITNTWIIFWIILVLAAVLRLWQFGRVPVGLDWDEASLGYNAFSVLHTGRDEFGKFLPVVMESFGDYKPALYAYLIIPFISFMGLTVQAVRMPSALFGIATVLLTFFLARRIFNSDKMGLVAMLLLAISPWHIQFSRIGFEANVGLFFNVLMATTFLYGLKKPWLLMISGASFALSIYTYQSEKVFTPLFALILIIIWWRDLWKLPKKYVALAIVTALLISAPMVNYMFTDKNFFARAEGVSILTEQNGYLAQSSQEVLSDHQHNDKIGAILDNRRILFMKTALGNYLSHYSLNWLFIEGSYARHRAPFMGLLYLWELPFLLIGIYLFLFSKLDKKYKWLVVLWFLAAPVPASITTGTPHEVRTLNFLPTFQLFTAMGLIFVWDWLKSLKSMYRWVVIFIATGLIGLNMVYYLDQYFVQQNYYAATDWRYGYQPAVAQVQKIQGNYTKIMVSNTDLMDQSYIFFLFYLQYPPQEYQHDVALGEEQVGGNHAFGKYQFGFVDPTLANCDRKTLVVGNYADFKQPLPAEYIAHYPNGTPGIEILGKDASLCKK